MSRIASSVAVLFVATAFASPVLAADWPEEEWPEVEDPCDGGSGGLRGSFEPKDWSGFGDECDPLSFEAGLRYWYSIGHHDMTVLGDTYVENDTGHIAEAHFRIDDDWSDVYLKGIAGYSAVISSTYSTPSNAAGASQSGRIKYLGGDIGYAPFGEGKTMLGGFVGYQFWNDSPDMGQQNIGAASAPNDLSYNVFKFGVGGRLDLGGIGDITAEVAAVPYAQVWGTYGAFAAPGGIGNQTSPGAVSGALWGATGEVMARFHPLENWTFGIGGRAWYLTGQADVTFSTDQGGGTNWITKTTAFTTFRYGILGEATYRF